MKNRKVTLQVLERITSDCPRCDCAVNSDKPNCPKCGLWLPWGDETVAAKRAERQREFVARELREESEWRQVRAQPNSQAPAFGLKFGGAHLWHVAALQLHEKRALVRGAFAVTALAAIGWMQVDINRMNRDQDAYNRKVARMVRQLDAAKASGAIPAEAAPVRISEAKGSPTGVCQDGSETFAQSRQGACSRHGGVAEFYN